ncbi:MAG: hypothetical protein Q9208_007999 [Pyrenodesmia sp. 3 TL-2023]
MAPPNAGKFAGLIPENFEGTVNLHMTEKEATAMASTNGGNFAGLVPDNFKGTLNLKIEKKEVKIEKRGAWRQKGKWEGKKGKGKGAEEIGEKESPPSKAAQRRARKNAGWDARLQAAVEKRLAEQEQEQKQAAVSKGDGARR